MSFGPDPEDCDECVQIDDLSCWRYSGWCSCCCCACFHYPCDCQDLGMVGVRRLRRGVVGVQFDQVKMRQAIKFRRKQLFEQKRIEVQAKRATTFAQRPATVDISLFRG